MTRVANVLLILTLWPLGAVAGALLGAAAVTIGAIKLINDCFAQEPQ